MKKVLLTVATLLAVSTGAMAADFAPKSEFNLTNSKKAKPNHPPRLVENNNSYSFINNGCAFSCRGLPKNLNS
ncbi:hypothetical protein [Acinetobacter sp. A47]|uniref:hypothetical protein n=1 Tax=Acinetobacter sp. A47 TaxID=1561217 RepID=UPI00126A27DA|nr:hypothetical protein [Acinetobacter sp. A47]